METFCYWGWFFCSWSQFLHCCCRRLGIALTKTAVTGLINSVKSDIHDEALKMPVSCTSSASFYRNESFTGNLNSTRPRKKSLLKPSRSCVSYARSKVWKCWDAFGRSQFPVQVVRLLLHPVFWYSRFRDFFQQYELFSNLDWPCRSSRELSIPHCHDDLKWRWPRAVRSKSYWCCRRNLNGIRPGWKCCTWK